MTLYEFSIGEYIQYKDSTWLRGEIFRLEPDGGYSIIRADTGIGYYILGSQSGDCHIYTPAKELVTTTGEKCVGYTLYKYYYVNGVYTRKELIEHNSPTCGYVPPDPCAGVTCPDKCDGTSLYSQKCVNGVCVNDALIESNSPTCGYTPPPAKGVVYQLDYPVSAKNGETITINASVLNEGGTSGEFSLRVIAAPQLLLVTRYVGWVAPDRFSVLESLSVTMPSSGSSANLGVQCIRHI